jgi:nucleoside-diphosphate-sugar epimerase
MKSRSVSITGATGFLGWHLAGAFRNAGWQVRAIVRPGNRKPLPEGIEAVEASLEPTSDALIRAFEPSSVVVHAAALTRARNEAAFNAVNVGGTRTVLDAVNRTGAHLIFVSSQAAIGTGTPLRPSREDDEPHPLTAYGRSKCAAEAAIRSAARVPWTIVRPSAVYGPRDRGFLPLFRLASRGLSPLVTRASTSFTLIYVEDVVGAIVLAASDPRAIGATVFLGHPQPARSDDILKAIAAAMNGRYRPLRVPSLVLQAAAAAGELSWSVGHQPLIDRSRLAELRAEGFVCAVDRARDVLGFTAAVGLTAGAERTARWYRDQGWV